jgi:beta-lactam-binding protein with PASTA domain
MSPIGEGSMIAGRYQLENRLDVSGRAQVWSASDQELGRKVAVKVLLSSESSDPSFLEEFRAEAQLEARLKHPGIVEVYDWGQEGDANYVVTELLEGQTAERLLDNGPMLPDRVVTLGRQVASALAYAHGEGIAHGSVGPDHVMVAPGGRTVSLFGFGLQCRGACERPAVPDADTYSLGILLYEALVGASPTGPRPATLPENREWPERPHKLNSDISRDLDQVVMRAISPNPAERYQTAAELQAALDGLIAAPAGKPSRTWLWALLAVLAVLAVLAGAWFFIAQARVTVPDVTRMPIAEAEAALSSAGLQMVVTGQVTSTELPAGVVVSENPAAGVKVRRGSEVGVTASTGKPTVAVPAVVGIEFKVASSTIASAGLVVGTVTQQNSTTFPADTVITQRPSAGQQLTAGSPVDLTVSAGQAKVTMPDVRGLSQTNATSKLTGLGLLVDAGSAYANQPSGIVVTQGPAPGSAVPTGSTVTISVSKGPAPVKVPNVVGAQSADAISSLQNLKLVPVSIPTTGTAAQRGLVCAAGQPSEDQRREVGAVFVSRSRACAGTRADRSRGPRAVRSSHCSAPRRT